MTLMTLLILLSAVAFALRTMKIEFLNEQTTLTKIGTLLFLAMVILGCFFESKAFNLIGAVGVFTFSLYQTQLETFLLLQKIDSWVLSTVSEVILHLRSGISLRSSLDLTVKSQTHPLKKKWLQQILDNVTFLQQESLHRLPPPMLNLLAAFHRCEAQPHLQTSLLENYRSLLVKKSEFRQRSDQALLQMRIQAVVVVLLYVAVSVVAKSIFGWQTVKPCWLFSAPFLLAGVGVQHWMRRSFNWKT